MKYLKEFKQTVNRVLCLFICAGVPDSYRGETVKVFVVLKPGVTVMDKKIIDF